MAVVVDVWCIMYYSGTSSSTVVLCGKYGATVAQEVQQSTNNQKVSGA